ncbi:MAG: helix-turn-helix transcriptional regulator [Acidobacteriaceae bacterium]
MWREELGKAVKAAREEKKWSQQQLADKTGITRERISQIENGRHTAGVKKITDIATALEKPIQIEGCMVVPRAEDTKEVGPQLVSQQFKLPFDVEHQIESTSVTLKKLAGDGVELRAVLSGWRRI